MTNFGLQAPESTASFADKLEILAEELELSVKWQRPCILMVVYSSEFVRADVEAALQNQLIHLGQKGIRLSVKQRDPKDVAAYFQEFKDPRRSVYLIDGFRWCAGDECHAFSTVSAQRDFVLEREVRAVFWVTPNEIMRLTRVVPDFWAYRQRVIEFADSPRSEQAMMEQLGGTWQAMGESGTEGSNDQEKAAVRESMLTELPEGDEAAAIRGNLLLTLSVMNWRKGDFEKAEEQLQQALRIAAKVQDNAFEAECFNALALIRSGTERNDEAIDAYKKAIELAPTKVQVWNNLGNLCAKVGRNDEAMIAFRKALEGNARDAIAWNGLASVHSKLGYKDEAISAYRRALQYTPTFAQPWCGLGDVHASAGRPDEALKCYHKAIELNKQYVAPWLRMGALFTKQERHRDAVRAYQKALALDGSNSQAWNDLGMCHLLTDAPDDAAAAFTKAIELDRGNGWAYSNLAQARMQQGRHKESVSLLLRSIELMPSDADKAVSWNHLGSVYRALNDYDNAMAAYQMADLLSGRSAALESPTAEEGEEMSAPPQEVPSAAALPDQEVKTLEGSKVAADEAEVRRPDATKAPAWIFESASNEPRPVTRKSKGAESKSRQEGGEVTVTGQTTIQSTTPGDAKKAPAAEAVKWAAKGNAAFKQGLVDEAITAYNKAIQLDAGYGVPYSNLALAYSSRGQYAEAVLLYQKSIELLESPRDQALAWNGLGNAYRCTDDYVNAVTAYQRAAELDPETGGIRDKADSFEPQAPQRSAAGWNALGELLLKAGSLDKAMEAFQKAAELEPAFGRAYSNLARTSVAEGKYSEALPLFEKSIALLETDKEKAEAWNGLGNVYRKLNDYDKAISAYQKAVALADEGVDLRTRARFSLLSNVVANQ